MLDTMLDLFYLFIFVAGAAGLGAIKRAGRKFFTGESERMMRTLGSSSELFVPVEERRPGRITARPRQWNCRLQRHQSTRQQAMR